MLIKNTITIRSDKEFKKVVSWLSTTCPDVRPTKNALSSLLIEKASCSLFLPTQSNGPNQHIVAPASISRLSRLSVGRFSILMISAAFLLVL
ncbi:hypothetical protein BDW72DRAFT_166473 [Aspergillus terricola var. indicus]